MSAFSDSSAQELGPLWFVCDTAGVPSPKVQEVSACMQCPCCIRALYWIYKQFILSCPWGNPALSPVLTVTGWQDASSELSLAFLCLHKTSAAVCPCWEMFYTWRAHSWFFQWFTVLLDMLSCEICYLLEVTLTAGFRV